MEYKDEPLSKQSPQLFTKTGTVQAKRHGKRRASVFLSKARFMHKKKEENNECILSTKGQDTYPVM